MANITLSGTLLDPNSGFAARDKIRFTHKTTTGSTLKGSVSTLVIGADGAYSIDLQYGLVLVERRDSTKSQYINLGVVTVNADNPATTLPELLSATVPVSSEELIEFQSILADCVAAQAAAEAAAAEAAQLGDNTGASLIGTSSGATVQQSLDALTAGQTGGVIVFATYALLDAYTPADATEEKSSFKVTNDPDSSKNGYYSWVSGTTYTKDASLVQNVIDPQNTSDAVSGAAVDNAVQSSDNSVLSKYSLTQQNFFSADAGGVTNFNGGTFVYEPTQQRIKVTATGGSRGIEYGPNLIEGKEYIAVVDFLAGTGTARLLRNWSNNIINPLVDGWNSVKFTAGASSAFGNNIIIASITAGDFYINSVHVYEIVDRIDVDKKYETPSPKYDLYYNDFSEDATFGAESLKDFSRFGAGTGTPICENGYLEVNPTSSGGLYIFGSDTEIKEGDWIDVEIDIEIVDTAALFRAYWDNNNGTIVEISSTGVHRFILKGDGNRTASTELQHMIMNSKDSSGGTIRVKDIKTRVIPAVVTNFTSNVNISASNDVLLSGGGFGNYTLLSTKSSYDDLHGSIIVGTECIVDNIPLWGAAFNQPSVCIGNEAEVHCGRNVAIGYQASTHSVSATAVGALSAAYQAHDIALGRGARTLKSTDVEIGGNTCLGSSSNLHVFPASGISSRFEEPGTGTVINVTPSSFRITYHGYDGFDDVDGTVLNIAGSGVNLSGGRGTGTADGGSVFLQTASASATSSNNKNALIDRVEVDTNDTNNETSMLLRVNGVLRRVKLGAPGSGGTGLTALVIDDI